MTLSDLQQEISVGTLVCSLLTSLEKSSISAPLFHMLHKKVRQTPCFFMHK